MGSSSSGSVGSVTDGELGDVIVGAIAGRLSPIPKVGLSIERLVVASMSAVTEF